MTHARHLTVRFGSTRRRITFFLTAALWSLIIATFHSAVIAGPLPEASSTLLQTHRRHYLQNPPHDTTLYDVLQVSSNATAAGIQKSYRRLVRRLHPDKRPQQDDEDDTSRKEQLEQVQQAYEILNDDSSRLPYHKYGLTDTAAQAVYILTGRVQHTEASHQELLRLMGYYHANDVPTRLSPEELHQRRLYFIAANLVEQIRPLVEERVPEYVAIDRVASDCDRLKRLPMGAQILRCIGRAYRHSGQQALLKRYHYQRHHRVGLLRQKWRSAKHLLTAVLASGRVVIKEQLLPKKPTAPTTSIGYHWDGGFGELESSWNDETSSQPPTEEEIKELEYRKAKTAVLESLQIEALWKLTKIDLDRTIREACNLILDGRYFFFHSRRHDGWVGSTGRTIDKETGQRRAAEALILLGDVMVARSKEGTAWTG